MATPFQKSVMKRSVIMKSSPTRRWTGWLLSAALIASLLVTPSLAAGSAEIQFQYPSDVKASEVTVSVYEGYPAGSGEAAVTALTEVDKDAQGDYVITSPGTYTYWVRGDGYYNISKIFNVTQEELNSGTVKLSIETGKLAQTGFEPTNPNLANTPENFAQDSRDALLTIWADEVLDKYFSTDTLKGYEAYDTPYFTIDRADHQFTTQDELMTYVQSKDEACDDMYLYSLGKTPVYNYDMPIAVFTTTDLSSAKTLEEAGEKVSANGKLTVWIQSQIHPNEPASGEGALVMISDLCGDYGKDVLKEINVVVIPRINPDGSYLFTRTTYQGFDMNRDHMALKAPELAYLHTAYRYFMPEVVMDGHEFTFYGVTKDGYMNNADDMQSTPASSLNNDPLVNKLGEATVDLLHKNATDSGLRVYHYGYTVNNPIGRAYYGLYNSISILVETRGIGAGSTNFARRVFSQQNAAHSIIEYAMANDSVIMAAVDAARADVVKKGATFEEDDIVVLQQVASGDTQSPTPLTRYQYNMDGSASKTTTATLSMNDTVVRSRIRPTAYVIPKDIENLDKILYILDNQGAEYYELSAGSTAPLKQYYYTGEYTYNGKDAGFTAALRDETQVTFDKGAIVIPMDQVAANVIAMTMEPDVNDSNGYDGTLVQYGLVSYDKDSQNFPIYRYEKDNPRTTLVSNGFADISGHWAKDAILYAASKGLMNGTSANAFSPDMNLSRSMIAQILYSLEGKPALAQADLEKKFSDVASDAWYANAVYWAQSKGIISGYGDGAFGPNDPVTREQLAAILSSYSKFKGMDVASKGSLSAFPDGASASSWAVQSLTWAVEKGLLSGMGDGTLNPTGTASRGQVAQIMMTYLEKVAK